MKPIEPTPPPLDELLSHAEFVRGLAHALVRDAQQAEDVAQETWVAALERPPTQRPRAWLASVVRRRAARMHRGRARQDRRQQAAARPEPSISTADRVAQAEQVRLLGDALCVLPDIQREAILLRYYEGLPPRVIARQLGIPVNTVRSRTRRGLERLRAELDERAGGDGRKWMAALVPLARGVATGPPALLAGIAVLTLAVVGATAFVVLRGTQRNGAAQEIAARTTQAGRVADRRAPRLRVQTEDSTLPFVVASAPPAENPDEPAAPAVSPGLVAFGTVTDLHGTPVAGATVSLRPARGALGTEVQTRSDDAGRFEARPAKPMLYRKGELIVESDGYAAERTDFVQGGRVDVRLDRGAALDVLVVDPDGAPQPGMEVGVASVVWQRAARTDRRGRARLPNLPFGPFTVWASSESHFGQSDRVVLAVETPSVQVVVEPRATLKGRVLHLKSREPIGGATVSLHHVPDGPPVTKTTAGTDGRFVLPLDAPGKGMLRAHAPGLGEVWPFFQRAGGGMAGLPSPGSAEPVVIRLGPANEVERFDLRVVDGGGKLAATRPGDVEIIPLLPSEVATSQDPAVFTCEVPAGTTLAGFSARHRDGRIGARSCNPARQKGPLAVTLADAGHLEGVVLDARGYPAPGAIVTLSVAGQLTLLVTHPEAQVHNAIRLVPEKIDVQRVTDSSGHFDFGPWTIGTYQLDVRHGRAGYANVKNVLVRVGESTQVDVRLQDGGQIRGRVVGMPAGFAHFSIHPLAWPVGRVHRGMPWRGRLFSDGSFEILGIPTQRADISLSIRLPDRYLKAIATDVAVGTSDLVLPVEEAVPPAGPAPIRVPR